MPRRLSDQLRVALVLAAVAAGFGCADQTEPLRSPIMARRFGGDSVVPGAMIRRCKPDDVGCIPAGAVACPAPANGGTTAHGPPLSPEEQAWCAANAGAVGRQR